MKVLENKSQFHMLCMCIIIFLTVKFHSTPTCLVFCWFTCSRPTIICWQYFAALKQASLCRTPWLWKPVVKPEDSHSTKIKRKVNHLLRLHNNRQVQAPSKKPFLCLHSLSRSVKNKFESCRWQRASQVARVGGGLFPSCCSVWAQVKKNEWTKPF